MSALPLSQCASTGGGKWASEAQVMCDDGAGGTHHGDANSRPLREWITWFEHCCLVSPDTGGGEAA